MGIYVLEIEGKAIAAFGDADYLEAEDWFDGKPFKQDLMCLMHKDRSSLWDGKSKFHIRQATKEEAGTWRESHQYAINTQGEDPGDTWLAFLVPVREPHYKGVKQPGYLSRYQRQKLT